MTPATLPCAALPTTDVPPIPVPRRPGERGSAATAYQRVLHGAVAREFRLLAELASWVTTDGPGRTAELTRHADLVTRVLLEHHAVESERLWPTLLRSVPVAERGGARRHVAAWAERTRALDHRLRQLATVARDWAATGSDAGRDAFVRSCELVADAVVESTAAEEADLLPLLAAHRPVGERWDTCRTASTLSGREQMLVLGLLLEDACAIDRARVLAGLPPSARTAWRANGRRNFHAAVVQLRGAPPAL